MGEVKPNVGDGDTAEQCSALPTQATLDSIIDRYAEKVLRQCTREQAAFPLMNACGCESLLHS